MRRVTIFVFCLAVACCAQVPLSVPFDLKIQGKAFSGRVVVQVRQNYRVVATGASAKNAIVFRWQPDDGATYDLEVTAGQHRIVITEVHAYDFHSTWAINLDFPPFGTQCGAEVPEQDRPQVVRVDCIVFDDGRGDPPQRVMMHRRVPR
jgi:hypothetical protein